MRRRLRFIDTTGASIAADPAHQLPALYDVGQSVLYAVFVSAIKEIRVYCVEHDNANERCAKKSHLFLLPRGINRVTDSPSKRAPSPGTHLRLVVASCSGLYWLDGLVSGDANGRPDGLMPDDNCGSFAKVPMIVRVRDAVPRLSRRASSLWPAGWRATELVPLSNTVRWLRLASLSLLRCSVASTR
jgi:hypothetical protein